MFGSKKFIRTGEKESFISDCGAAMIENYFENRMIPKRLFGKLGVRKTEKDNFLTRRGEQEKRTMRKCLFQIPYYLCGMTEVQEKTVKSRKKLSKEVLNIIRTTQRNNIELTSIADNKANMLLSLNGIMISIALPLFLSNTEVLTGTKVGIPVLILSLTCFCTMYISALVLRPSNFDTFNDTLAADTPRSPFFFGNFFRMEAGEFFEDVEKKLENKEELRDYVTQDLFFVGRRLGHKMQLIRTAFNIFIFGIFLTLFATAVLFVFF